MSTSRHEARPSQWGLIEQFVHQSSRLFLKKLSRNDTSWADDGGGHQSGFYVPREVRESGFFPELSSRADKPHIFESICPSLWPQTSELRSDSRIKFFSNKRSECHFTRIPKDLFLNLNPASWLLGGTLEHPLGVAHHWFIVIDSESDDAELLETRVDVPADFHFGLFAPSQFSLAERIEADHADELVARIDQALRQGTLPTLLAEYARLPKPEELAKEARELYLNEGQLSDLDPWRIKNPGDAVMRISRDIEYSLYKKYELRLRAVQVAAVLADHTNIASAAVRGYPLLDSIFLSASQQRKSRSGTSFENHLAVLLKAGGVKHEAQAVLGQRRPDFVLPSRQVVSLRSQRDYYDAAILSAKTTLRERWKQITHERFNCAIFLATVDDRISKETLGEIRDAGITLLVPESMKSRSSESFYWEDPNVISFRTFFDEELARRRPGILMRHPKRDSESGL